MLRVLARYTLVGLVALPLAACKSSHDKRYVERSDESSSSSVPGQHEFHDSAHAFAQGVAASDLPEARGGGKARVACRAHQIRAFPGVDTGAFAREICQALEETGKVQIIEGTEGVTPDYGVRGQVQKTGKTGSSIYLELIDSKGRAVVRMPRAYAKPLNESER